jgi:hypothetical protein
VRLGNLVSALPLSYRLLAQSVGVAESDALLDEYETSTTTQAWALAEAEQFLEYAQQSMGSVAHLAEVIRFELAAQAATLDRSPVTVDFTCEPGPLLSALRVARPIPELTAGNFRVTVDPAGHGTSAIDEGGSVADRRLDDVRPFEA